MRRWRQSACFNTYVLPIFPNPQTSGEIYQAIRKIRAKKIVEFGVGMGVRAKRLIQVAQRYSGDEQVGYCGIDLFEARSSHDPGWTLKRSHRELDGHRREGQADSRRSVHGADAIGQFAFGHRSHRHRSRSRYAFAGTGRGFYVPRMLHENSRVFCCSGRTGPKVRRNGLPGNLKIGGCRPATAASGVGGNRQLAVVEGSRQLAVGSRE